MLCGRKAVDFPRVVTTEKFYVVVDITDSIPRTGTVKPSSRKVMSRECRY